jgi:hypothetical protein
MNLKTIEKTLQLLRAYGVSHFKTAEVEIRIGAPPSPDSLIAVGAPPIRADLVPTKPNAGDVRPVSVEIPHHINKVKEMLKLSDEDLVDRMFPEAPLAPEKAE